MSDGALDAVAARVRAIVEGGRRPALVAVAGPVAVGKSTFALALSGSLSPLATEVVSTDGFLMPNDELMRLGLLMQKGFPGTYDDDAIGAFLDDLRAGRPGHVPVYSHATYDRVPGAVRVVDDADVVVLEGVNALQPGVAERVDLGVYLDAPEPLVRSWYVTRFVELIAAAEAGEASFYARFADLDDAARTEMAERVWEAVNLVNLTDHVEPTRDAAHLVIMKSAGHALAIAGEATGP